MNYPAMRYVASEDCTVKGPARAVLWVIAYHSNPNGGECWVGQRRLSQESGFARSTVQRALNELFELGVLVPIADRQGPKAERYMIATGLVEGEAFGTGIVEGASTASDVVEGHSEVIPNQGASGLAPGPQAVGDAELVDSLSTASGLARGREAPLVDSLADSSGLLPTSSPAGTAPKVLSKGFELQGSKQGARDDATASAVVAPEEPPASLLAELERRGLRRPPKAPAIKSASPPPRSREEQLAELERIMAEDQAKSAKNGEASA